MLVRRRDDSTVGELIEAGLLVEQAGDEDRIVLAEDDVVIADHGFAGSVRFCDGTAAWVHDPDHPGCGWEIGDIVNVDVLVMHSCTGTMLVACRMGETEFHVMVARSDGRNPEDTAYWRFLMEIRSP